jgi:hypothetical protein
MIQIREHKHQRLSTGHAVATVLVCASLLANVIVTNAMVMIVARKKEAAP